MLETKVTVTQGIPILLIERNINDLCEGISCVTFLGGEGEDDFQCKQYGSTNSCDGG